MQLSARVPTKVSTMLFPIALQPRGFPQRHKLCSQHVSDLRVSRVKVAETSHTLLQQPEPECADVGRPRLGFATALACTTFCAYSSMIAPVRLLGLLHSAAVLPVL